jgi:hypothetical protein
MTNDTLHLDAHPADGDLLRLIDGACDPSERIRLERHLIGCALCKDTARIFRATSSELDGALNEMEVSPPADARTRILAAAEKARRSRAYSGAGRWQRPSLRAAAVIGLLVASGMWVPPVRAWVFEFFSSPLADQGERLVAPEVVAPPPPEAFSTISFVPTAPTFTVEIAARQTSGSLVFRVGQGDVASARITGPSSADSFLVTSEGIRIDNSATSNASYELTVPLSLSSVRVQFGGGETRLYTVASMVQQDSLALSLRPR